MTYKVPYITVKMIFSQTVSKLHLTKRFHSQYSFNDQATLTGGRSAVQKKLVSTVSPSSFSTCPVGRVLG